MTVQEACAHSQNTALHKIADKDLGSIRQYYQDHYDTILAEYFDFLRIPSISRDSEYAFAVRQCAEWLKEYLEDMGFEAEFWETSGSPTVFAKNLEAGSDKPTLLIYNHYDVQPVTPVEEWETEPFSPTMIRDKLYCRGAQDNKGQCFYVLQAIKAIKHKDGALPINIKIIIDGEEEKGSPGLSEILDEHQEALQADTLTVVDLGIKIRDVPCITLGVRGLVSFDVEVGGPVRDVHSGGFGGKIKNPNQEMIHLLSKLHDENGKVAVPGFYDRVKTVTESEKSMLSLGHNEDEFRETYGVPANGGEIEYSPDERTWIRPTIEINGISGGGVGEQSKTVIPKVSRAYLTSRLVPNQEPNEIGKLISDYLHSQAPKDVKITVSLRPGIGLPARTSPESSSIKAFADAYTKVFGKSCEYKLAGGSIPIASSLSEVSGADLVLMGLGLPEDKAHAPNESFDMQRFEMGMLIMAEGIMNLSK